MRLFRQYSLWLTSTYTSTTTFAKEHFDKKSTILFYVYLHFRQTLGKCLQVWESVIDDSLLGIYVVTSTAAERSNQIKNNNTIIKHFHSIFKVCHTHSKKSIHLLTAIFLLRKVAFSQIEYISRAF